MINHLKNLILWLVVVFLIMFAILQYRAAWADCPNGFTGEIVASIPPDSQVIDTGILLVAFQSATQYAFIIGAHAEREYILPISAVTVFEIDPTACTYYVEYLDDIFGNGFEGN